jgi:tRNA(Ile)-lysidine synthetase-like protein
VIVRFWEPGDRFVPLGMQGRKKLQDFFVDAKLPRDQRSTVPLMVSGGEIAWVVGFRVDERFKVTDTTRRIIRVRVAHAGSPEADLGGPRNQHRMTPEENRKVGGRTGADESGIPLRAETTIRRGFCIEKPGWIW